MPLVEAIRAHLFGAERIHADDTTVPVLAKDKTRAGRLGPMCVTVFAGSDEGDRQAAAIYALIATAKLNNVDPQAWLADMLARLSHHPVKRIHELLPRVAREGDRQIREPRP
jgi:hypothetical protein